MAALDFPSAPTVGQYFVAGNGVTYQWNGTMWLPVGSSSGTYFGELPPPSPGQGQLWFNTTLATLYIYYNDGSSTQWVPTNPVPAPAIAPTIIPTGLLQTVYFQTGAVATGTTAIPFDDTIPQITEGTEFMSLAITPLSATSKLVVEVVWNGAHSYSSASTILACLFRDSGVNALATGWVVTMASGYSYSISFKHIVNPSGSTAPTTFRVRAGNNQAGTTTFNGGGGFRYFGGSLASSILIQETL